MKSTELCPRLQKSMDIIGRRWTGLIIYQLLQGPQRFGEIESSLPVSGRLLSERLKELEQEGIVLREVFPETPSASSIRLQAKAGRWNPSSAIFRSGRNHGLRKRNAVPPSALLLNPNKGLSIYTFTACGQ